MGGSGASPLSLSLCSHAARRVRPADGLVRGSFRKRNRPYSTSGPAAGCNPVHVFPTTRLRTPYPALQSPPIRPSMLKSEGFRPPCTRRCTVEASSSALFASVASC